MGNYLAHHGIKGQKWGVRRFQDRSGRLTQAGKERRNAQHTSANGVLTNSKLMNTQVGNDALMELAVYSTVAVSYVALLYGVSKLSQKSLQKKWDSEIDDMYADRDIQSLKAAPRLKKQSSPSENMKVVNPEYPNPGSTQNCMMCTTAMVLREKGYDVKANTSSHGFYEKNVDSMWGEGGQFKKVKAKTGRDLINTLQNEGDGAYGNLTVQWKLGGGHSIFWKNENGKTHIYDGQSGKEYDVSKPSTSQLLSSINPGQSKYSRLDNVEPNDRVLAFVQKRN